VEDSVKQSGVWWCGGGQSGCWIYDLVVVVWVCGDMKERGWKIL